MGKSGNIGWGISTYFKLPNRKKKLLTKEFLLDFKNEIINMHKETDRQRGCTDYLDYEQESYLSFYAQIESTVLFYNALEKACKKHNLTKAIYEYAKNMPWFDSDCFDDDLVLQMVDKGIIRYDNDQLTEPDYYKDLQSTYKLVKKCKGYNVVTYDSWFSDSREELEEIYSDGEWEVIWLN